MFVFAKSFLSEHCVKYDSVHCVKNVRIRSFSGHYLPTFGLNTEINSINFRALSECGKTKNRKIPNTDTFYAVVLILENTDQIKPREKQIETIIFLEIAVGRYSAI